jgi:hypothetical protein
VSAIYTRDKLKRMLRIVSRLLSMTEKVLIEFSNLLYQQQGLLLMKLSQAVEPAVMALVTGKLASKSLFPIEKADARLIEGLPKGSWKIFELITEIGS